MTHVDLGHLEAALADYTRALELDPVFAVAYYNRGTTYAVLEQHDAALADDTRALEFVRDDAEIYINRGVIYAALGQPVAALTDFLHALTIDPAHATAHLNIGILAYQQDNFAEAIPHLEQAARLGEPQAAELVVRTRQLAEQEADLNVNPEEQAWLAFAEAGTPTAMEQALVDFPLLAEAAGIDASEQAFAQRLRKRFKS